MVVGDNPKKIDFKRLSFQTAFFLFLRGRLSFIYIHDRRFLEFLNDFHTPQSVLSSYLRQLFEGVLPGF